MTYRNLLVRVQQPNMTVNVHHEESEDWTQVTCTMQGHNEPNISCVCASVWVCLGKT